MKDNVTLALADGIIQPDSARGELFGFTHDKFFGWLWKDGDTISISCIESLDPGKGNFRQLVSRIREMGFKVEIPTPLGRMEQIVEKNGYAKSLKVDSIMGKVEVWMLG